VPGDLGGGEHLLPWHLRVVDEVLPEPLPGGALLLHPWCECVPGDGSAIPVDLADPVHDSARVVPVHRGAGVLIDLGHGVVS
jgi:hypothetical protein